jgi:hypothetical protein
MQHAIPEPSDDTMRVTPAFDRSTLATALVLASGPWLSASGQGGLTPRAGEQVRVRIVSSETASIGSRCAGSVAAVVGDTVMLGQPRTCPAGSHLAELRVARGSHGSRLVHTAIGFVGGALAGGILARISIGDGCTGEGCTPAEGAYAVAIATAIGAAAGAVVGTLVGAALPAGPRWLDTTAPRPLVVAGLEVRPGVRVSFDDRSGR